MLEVERIYQVWRHGSGACKGSSFFLQADVLGIFMVPSFPLRLSYELALAQRTLRCFVLWELSIHVSCLLYNAHLKKNNKVNTMHGKVGFQNGCEKARNFTLDVHHDLLFVLCRAVANDISIILSFSFFLLRCWR